MLTFTEAITEVLKDGTHSDAHKSPHVLAKDGSVRIIKLKNHAKVGYQDHPLGDKQCSSCSMFVPPGACMAVEPPISPSGYCQIYERSDLSQKLREMFGDIAGVAAGVTKQQPGAADVHVTTALGNEGRRRKAKDFLTTIGEMKGAKVVEVPDDDVGKKKDRSKTVKVFIVRHGKTKMNNEVDMSEDRIRGWADVPLVQEGRDEAKRTGKKLEKMGVEAIISSDLSRASETADIIGKIVGVKPSTTTKLRPWDLGKYTGMSTKDALPHIIEYIHDKPDEPVPDGESFNDFRARAFSGLTEAIKRAGGKQLVIVTHHRNERLFSAWDEAGQPDDHSIDLKEFTKKGEPPGSVMEFDVGTDALAGKQDDENAVAKQTDDDEDVNAALHLYPLADDPEMAKTPFPWDQNAMSNLRPDQTPRFLAALTDPQRLPIKTVGLNTLVAVQNRVDPNKVQSMVDDEPDVELPVVVRFNGRNIIADGHHRLAAHLLTGRKTAPVRFADLTAEDNAVKREIIKGSPDQPRDDHGRFAGGEGESEASHPDWIHGHEGSDIASAMEDVPNQINDSASSIEDARSALEDASNKAIDIAEQEDDHEVGSKEYAQWEKEHNAAVADVADKTMALHQAVANHLEATRSVLGQLTSIINDHARSSGVRAKKMDKRFRAVVKCPECGAEKGQWHKIGCSGHVPGDVEGMEKQDWVVPFQVVAKSDDQQLVFGFASVSSINGDHVIDKQGDIIPREELENAVYDYVLYCRKQGDMHERVGIGRLVESMVLTKEKEDQLNKVCKQLAEEMGFDFHPISFGGFEAWWAGYKVDDLGVWKRIKAGDLPEFSIGGKAVREPVEAS